MKQLTHNLLKVNFAGIDWSEVSRIEFAFSQNIGEIPLKTAKYPSETAFELIDNQVGIVWTAAETELFKAGKPFYLDTRITLEGSPYQPETPILRLTMNPTLFEE